MTLTVVVALTTGTALASHGKVTQHSFNYSSASWYNLSGRTTACGVLLNSATIGVAHKWLPCGTKIEMCTTYGSRCLMVPVIDRGPYVAGRDFDLTQAAMSYLGGIGAGVITVRWYIIH